MTPALQEKIDILNANFDQLKEEYGVKKFGIFGSFARGEETKKSDIDILVEFSEPITMFGLLELEERLSKLLGRKVDLVTKGGLKPIIKKKILNSTIYA